MTKRKISQWPSDTAGDMYAWQNVMFESYDAIVAGDVPDGRYWPRNVWVQGPRRSGTSYTASFIYDLACEFFAPVNRFQLPSRDVIDAADLEELRREVWRLEREIKTHASDHALYMEFDRQSALLEWYLSKSPVVLVDNLHSGDPSSYWLNFLAQHLDRRPRKHKVGIVATDMPITEVFNEGQFEHLWSVVALEDRVI